MLKDKKKWIHHLFKLVERTFANSVQHFAMLVGNGMQCS